MIRRLIRSATLLIHVLRGQCEGKIHCRAAAGSLRGNCCNIATLEPRLARYRRCAPPDFNQAISVSVPFVRMALFSSPVVRACRPCRACHPGRYDRMLLWRLLFHPISACPTSSTRASSTRASSTSASSTRWNAGASTCVARTRLGASGSTACARPCRSGPAFPDATFLSGPCKPNEPTA